MTAGVRRFSAVVLGENRAALGLFNSFGDVPPRICRWLARRRFPNGARQLPSLDGVWTKVPGSLNQLLTESKERLGFARSEG